MRFIFLCAFSALLIFNFETSKANISEVPKKEFSFWNDNWETTSDNNCYNYATNRVTNNFAQPGQASGMRYQSLTCGSVFQAAKADVGVVPRGYFPFTGKSDETLLALVVANDYDYHWYRRDDDGTWSHKMGGTPATDVDDSGQLIDDPETADRGLYTEFCGYFAVKNYLVEDHEQDAGQVKIGNMMDLPSLNGEVQILKYSGRRNPTVDLERVLNDSHQRSLLTYTGQTVKQFVMAPMAKAMDRRAFHRLGYRGVMIQDPMGLVLPAGSRLQILGDRALYWSPGAQFPVILTGEYYAQLERSLLNSQ